MGLGGRRRDYEVEVPRRQTGPTPEAIPGENRSISGCLRSPPQAPSPLPELLAPKSAR